QEQEGDYANFVKEKLSGKWFAALLPDSPRSSYQILRRFESWSRFMDFLQEHDAIVDVWAYGENPESARRLSALDVARLKKSKSEQPTFLTVTYRTASSLLSPALSSKGGEGESVGADGTGTRALVVVTNRVEFGF